MKKLFEIYLICYKGKTTATFWRKTQEYECSHRTYPMTRASGRRLSGYTQYSSYVSANPDDLFVALRIK